jgi:hypothetical protein
MRAAIYSREQYLHRGYAEDGNRNLIDYFESHPIRPWLPSSATVTMTEFSPAKGAKTKSQSVVG